MFVDTPRLLSRKLLNRSSYQINLSTLMSNTLNLNSNQPLVHQAQIQESKFKVKSNELEQKIIFEGNLIQCEI